MGETIVLPKSGLVLTRSTHPIFLEHGIQNFTADILERYLVLESRPDFIDAWRAEFWRSASSGTRDECIAWLDARVLETRATLTPPGHVLVGPEARETVARESWEFNRVCEWTEATEDEKTDYLLGADAVLAALGVRGGE